MLSPDQSLPATGAGGGFYRLDHEESYLEVLLSPDNQGADLAPGESTVIEVEVSRIAWDAWLHPETGEILPPRNERITPVEGVSLSFAPAGDALVSSADATTDASGRAWVTFTGGTAGSTLAVTAVTADGTNASSNLWLPSDWVYVRTEGTIEAELTSQSHAALQLTVTYSSWDVFFMNRGQGHTISNVSASPAVGALVTWAIDSGNGMVSKFPHYKVA